ncbi:MAG: efflux RND transporter periplasmic adaptor subunit [Planctomycetes bacterium]|nr:efflux RND transporter periplasmic adaptor subunit [Planctomycetota bacterium]
MKGWLTLLILAIVCAGVFSLGSLRRDSDGKPALHIAEEVALTVDVAAPEKGEIIRLVQAPGDVEAVLEVEISSEIVSKIIEMPVEEGDPVKAGDLLCRLDDKNLLADVESGEARVAQLGASIKQAEADVEKADRDVARQAALSESNATSDIELRDTVTRRKKFRAVLEMRQHELSQSEAFLKRAREDLKKTVITSPIDGVISRLNAKQGEVVVTGTMNNAGTVIMSISDLSSMQVRARVDEVDVPLVKAGQTGRVYLQSDPDVPVPARVVRVSPKGSRASGRDVVTFEALLEVLSTEERIKPGMTANVEIEVDRRDDAVTVPVEAVVHRMRRDLPEKVVEAFDRSQEGLNISERVRRGQYIKVIYVMEDEVARVRLIDTGIADTRLVEIEDGIELGDSVIIGPYRSLDQLEDGKKVALAEDKKDVEKPESAEKEQVAEDDQTGQRDEDAEKERTVVVSTKSTEG